ILSDDEIKWESRKLGAVFGFSAMFVAMVFGSKALGLSPRMNAASSAATGGVSGYMWHGFTRQAYQKKRRQLLIEQQQNQETGGESQA
ncbi:hypothetical protein LPJ81_003893, partial [Coemansia sp. IMI 209127]